MIVFFCLMCVVDFFPIIYYCLYDCFLSGFIFCIRVYMCFCYNMWRCPHLCFLFVFYSRMDIRNSVECLLPFCFIIIYLLCFIHFFFFIISVYYCIFLKCAIFYYIYIFFFMMRCGFTVVLLKIILYFSSRDFLKFYEILMF